MARTMLRFRDLKERGIVHGWNHLKHRVETEGFPAGFMMGERTRFWFEDSVEAWLESRPSALDAKAPLRGVAAKHNTKTAEAS